MTDTAADATPEELPETDGPSFCYRHPDRETWVRCGRCDRPICTRCAMQGPVGLRCASCGKPAFDPLTSVKPLPALAGLALAVAGGALAAVIASRMGFFAIILSWFAGSLIVQAVHRVTGYKHGSTITAIVIGGIVAGAAIGFAVDYVMLMQDIAAMAAAAGEQGYDYPLTSMLMDEGVWALVSAIACCVGAWQRLR